MTDQEIHKIILSDLKEIRADIKDLRKDVHNFKIKVIGFLTVLVAGAEIVKIYLTSRGA